MADPGRDRHSESFDKLLTNQSASWQAVCPSDLATCQQAKSTGYVTPPRPTACRTYSACRSRPVTQQFNLRHCPTIVGNRSQVRSVSPPTGPRSVPGDTTGSIRCGVTLDDTGHTTPHRHPGSRHRNPRATGSAQVTLRGS